MCTIVDSDPIYKERRAIALINAKNAPINKSYDTLHNIQGIARMTSGKWSGVRRKTALAPTKLRQNSQRLMNAGWKNRHRHIMSEGLRRCLKT